MSVIYPTRARIIDADGVPIGVDIVARTPDESRKHVGKEGLAEKLADGYVSITLDDGSVLMGYECWWQPLPAQREGER